MLSSVEDCGLFVITYKYFETEVLTEIALTQEAYKYLKILLFNSLTTRDKIAEFANSLDLDEVAQNEPPHLDLHCLPSSL